MTDALNCHRQVSSQMVFTCSALMTFQVQQPDNVRFRVYLLSSHPHLPSASQVRFAVISAIREPLSIWRRIPLCAAAASELRLMTLTLVPREGFRAKLNKHIQFYLDT